MALSDTKGRNIESLCTKNLKSHYLIKVCQTCGIFHSRTLLIIILRECVKVLNEIMRFLMPHLFRENFHVLCKNLPIRSRP